MKSDFVEWQVSLCLGLAKPLSPTHALTSLSPWLSPCQASRPTLYKAWSLWLYCSRLALSVPYLATEPKGPWLPDEDYIPQTALQQGVTM